MASPACSIPAIIFPAIPPLISLSGKASPKIHRFTHRPERGNRRMQLDNSLTFGGFHWNDPRQIYAEFRYRFHY